MSISIMPCPKCGTLVLDDTVQCHRCHHILDQAKADELALNELPTDEAVRDDMSVCKECGEPVRSGLVRCWNCGAFTREEIEAAYRAKADANPALPETPRRVATENYSTASLSREGNSADDEFDSLPPLVNAEASPAAKAPVEEEDDFELDTNFQLAEASVPEWAGDGAFFAEDPPPARPLPPRPEYVELPEIGAPTPKPAAAVPAASAQAPASPAAPAADTFEIPPPELPANALTEAAANQAAEGDEDDLPHSEATAGDVLLKMALKDEVEQTNQLRRLKQAKRGFIVNCEKGHKIRVQEYQRGLTGKCPKCGSPFHVPEKEKPAKVETPAAASAAPQALSVGQFGLWMKDVSLHRVVAGKFKIKPESLKSAFLPADVALSADAALLLVLDGKGKEFSGGAKTRPMRRAKLHQQIVASEPFDKLGAAERWLIPGSHYPEIALVQPAPVDTESPFANVPVFGIGRIAVRLPITGEKLPTFYLSFSLTEFRQFSGSLAAMTGQPPLGRNSEVPLEDHYETHKCHYNETPVRELTNLLYYQKDPAITLAVSGWRCAGCGLIISEEARRKEKIGGLDGKAIARAKCPKCQKKFGNLPMYEVAGAAKPVT